VIPFYEIRRLRGVVPTLSDNLQVLSHLDDANWKCLKFFL